MKIDGFALLQNAFFIIFLIISIVLSSPQKFSAQEQKTVSLPLTSDTITKEKDDLITVNTNLITFNVSVTDINGLAVTGLSKSDFNIFDNRMPQEIHFFSDADAPASISVILDTSGSMSGSKINQAKEALAHFMQTSKEQDEFFLIDVGSKANLLLNRTRDSDAVLERFTYVQPNGNTALYDAVNLGLKQVTNGSHSRKIVLVISDGEDNNSRSTFKELKNQLKESNVIIYTIGFGGYFSSVQRGLSGRDVLKELASASGGKAFFPNNSNEVDEAFERIALDIRHLYSIGYYPSEFMADGKNHQVMVKIKTSDPLPRFFIHSRKEYTAGATQ